MIRFLLLLIFAPIAGADSLVSQVYPADQPQPIYFRIIIDGAPTPVLKRADQQPDGGRYLDFDLSSQPPGEHSYEFHACNFGGCSGPAERPFKPQPPEKPVMTFNQE